jgi:CheY-like chemotaxis protein
MDGWEATRTIRDTKSNHWNPSIPIVAMTANNSEDDRRNCLAVGMDGFLSKPLVPEALRAEIVHWLPDAFPRACDDPTQFEPNSHAAVDARIDCAINAENANKPATSSEAAVVIYDRSGVLARLMGDAALAALVAQTFLNDMPRQIAALHRSVEARDRAHAELIAHTIRGAASSAGAISLSGLAQQFEAAAATAQWSALQTAANQIEAAFHEAKHQMECPDNM